MVDLKVSERAINILNYLKNNGSVSQKELFDKLNLPVGSIRHSLRRLMEEGLIISKPDLFDRRSRKYSIAENTPDIDGLIDKLNQSKVY